MSVLSDTTLRELIGQNELIENGDASNANNCAYDFKPARVVFGGIAGPAQQVISLDIASQGSATIAPSAVAWVQSRERVKIPKNMVGMWVQTNSLSRSGLLLLNSTLVEPGYEGHLAAHFVNLGASPVSLSSNKTIAKLIFLKLDQDATELVDGAPFNDYNALIDDLAARSHASFLRIKELVPDLDAAAANSVKGAQKEISDHIKSSIAEAKDQLVDLKKETFLKVGGGFVVGFALAVAFSLMVFPFLRNVDNESEQRIEAIVDEQNKTLRETMDEVRKQLDALRSNQPTN